MLEVTPVPAFRDNYIWLIHAPEDRTRVLAVDPGDAGPVQSLLSARQWALAGILVTHHHADHTGGVPRLAGHHGCPVYGPKKEVIPAMTRALGAGDTVSFPTLGLEFSVIEVPGHTAGHIAFYGHGALFCGDTLFSAGCGRLFEGTPGEMLASLDVLAGLPASTQVYCTHEYTESNLAFAAAVEPDNRQIAEYREKCAQLRRENRPTLPSTIDQEKRINPFLRVDMDSVRQAAASRGAGSGRTEIFAAIREWKDGFQG
jgi:hydroxyacylglutathione hydrolase